MLALHARVFLSLTLRFPARHRFPSGHSSGFHVDANRFSALLLLAEWSADGQLLHNTMPTDVLRQCQLQFVHDDNHSFISTFLGEVCGQPVVMRGCVCALAHPLNVLVSILVFVVRSRQWSCLPV